MHKYIVCAVSLSPVQRKCPQNRPRFHHGGVDGDDSDRGGVDDRGSILLCERAAVGAADLQQLPIDKPQHGLDGLPDTGRYDAGALAPGAQQFHGSRSGAQRAEDGFHGGRPEARIPSTQQQHRPHPALRRRTGSPISLLRVWNWHRLVRHAGHRGADTGDLADGWHNTCRRIGDMD